VPVDVPAAPIDPELTPAEPDTDELFAGPGANEHRRGRRPRRPAPRRSASHGRLSRDGERHPRTRRVALACLGLLLLLVAIAGSLGLGTHSPARPTGPKVVRVPVRLRDQAAEARLRADLLRLRHQLAAQRSRRAAGVRRRAVTTTRPARVIAPARPQSAAPAAPRPSWTASPYGAEFTVEG
jgi:hypothetical protein